MYVSLELYSSLVRVLPRVRLSRGAVPGISGGFEIEIAVSSFRNDRQTTFELGHNAGGGGSSILSIGRKLPRLGLFSFLVSRPT